MLTIFLYQFVKVRVFRWSRPFAITVFQIFCTIVSHISYKKKTNTTYYEYKINSKSGWPLGEQTDMGATERNNRQLKSSQYVG